MATNKWLLNDERSIIDKETAVFRKYRFLLNPSNYYFPSNNDTVNLADDTIYSCSINNSDFKNEEEMAQEYAQLVRNAEYFPSWSRSVMAVLMTSNDLVQYGQCSICLNDPAVLPRINRCGHIFCLSCLWEYIVSGEAPQTNSITPPAKNSTTPLSRAWDITAKRYVCPLCLVRLEINDLRPVIIQGKSHDNHFNCSSRCNTIVEDNPIVLDLKTRWAKGTVVVAADPNHDSKSDFSNKCKLSDLPWDCSQEGTSIKHAQYTLVTETFVRRQLARELEEATAFNNAQLKTLAVTNAISTDTIKYLNREYEHTLGALRGFDASSVLAGKCTRRIIVELANDDSSSSSSAKRRQRKKKFPLGQVYLSGSSGPSSSSSISSPSSISSSTSSSMVSLVTPIINDRLFFYQPRDMSRTYLSYLDFKIILAWFGQFDQFPVHIENARILRFTDKDGHVQCSGETTIVDADVKHRIRYLNYLPLGATITFMEIDWMAMDQVPQEVLRPFEEQLNRRKRNFENENTTKANTNAEDEEVENMTKNLETLQVSHTTVDQSSVGNTDSDPMDYSDPLDYENEGYNGEGYNAGQGNKYGDKYDDEYHDDNYFDEEADFEDPDDFDYVHHYGNYQRFDSRPYMEHERQNEGPSSWLEGFDLTTPLKTLAQDETPLDIPFKTKGKKQKKFLVISSGNQRKL